MLEKIKVGGIDYDVYIKDLSKADTPELIRMGMHSEVQAVIEVSDKLSKQKRDQTFVHEMLHAVVSESGAIIEKEEEVVNQLGLVLYQVLKDNDLSFIREEKRSDKNGKRKVVNYLV